MGEYINSKQVKFSGSSVSCGVVEAHHLPDESPSRTIFAIANHLYHKANGRPAAFVMFSDVVDRKESRGLALANAIQTMGIGRLLETEKQVNPKTGNVILVWIWSLDHENFRKWYTEEYVNRLSDEA